MVGFAMPSGSRRNSAAGAGPVRATLLALALIAAGPLSVVVHEASHMVSVIVRGQPGGEPAAAQAVRSSGGTVVRTIKVIDGVAARVPADQVGRLESSPAIREVTPDRPLHLQGLKGLWLAQPSYAATVDVGSFFSTTQISGAQSFWQAGYTGQGIDVAVIDSGYVPVDGLSVPGKELDGPDLSWESQAPNLQYRDTFGHGTMMAGLAVGRDDAAVPGTYAGDSTDFLGMAPDSRLVSIKVADAQGNADVSQVLAAIDWVIQHHADPGLNIRVVNMSFGTDSYQSYVYDPLTYAAEAAWHAGVVVVAAAGNSGWKTGLNDPADDPYLIAVGAANTQGTDTTSDDTVATFSAGGDGYRNPDLVAPGIHMVGLRDPGSYIDTTYPTAEVGTRYFRGSGTSEATAVVSGAAALVLSEHPALTPDMVKNLLTSTATPLAGQPVAMQGAGELNLGAALTALPAPAVQAFAPSTGTGSIEGARGSVHVVHNGVTLQGELDIMGSPVNTSQLATAESNGVAWLGGSFNGVIWTGQGWVGAQWACATWTGDTFAGDLWSNSSWSNSSWSNSSWSNSSWSNSSWSNSSWSNSSWSSNMWSSATYDSVD